MLFSAWTITGRRWRVVGLLVAMLVIAPVGGLIVAGRGARAADAPTAQRIDLASGLPGFAPWYRLSLTEATVPPGAGFAPHRHPGMQVAYIRVRDAPVHHVSKQGQGMSRATGPVAKP
jgi:hypothetical protein